MEDEPNEMTKELSEAGKHYKQLTDILKKNSSYPEPSLVSHKHLCSEWMVIQSGYDELAGMKCECGKENISHYNTIRNHHNGLILSPIGSKCIKRFEIKPLGISCMCCAKPLGETNPFLQAYMEYSPVTKETLIIGHKRCAVKLFEKAKSFGYFGRYGWYLKGDFVSYFNRLGVKIQLDEYGHFDIEYDNEKLTPYMNMVCD
jgi:hypothetical protein